MGSGSSHQLPNIAIVPFTSPVAAISERFCHNELFTLQQHTRSLSSTLTFRNIHTGVESFAVRHMEPLSSRLTLLDSNGVAIINAKHRTFSSKPIYYVHLGSEYDADAVLEIYARYHGGLKTEACVSFIDLRTRELCALEFEGHWRKRMGYFWLNRGGGGHDKHVPVAKVYRPEGVSRWEYRIAIAPNMDTALITMLCAILVRLERQSE